MSSIKSFFVNLYHQKGKDVGIYLLKNIGIAAICVIVLNIISCVKPSFRGILEWLISLPIISVLVIIIRFAITSVHKIIPMRTGIAKSIFDFIIFCIVMTAIAFFMDKIPMPESDFVQILIAVLFDVMYIALIIFLLLPSRHKNNDK